MSRSKIREKDWVLFETDGGLVQGNVLSTDGEFAELAVPVPHEERVDVYVVASEIVPIDQIVAVQVGWLRKKWKMF